MATAATLLPDFIDTTTISSLLAVLALLSVAYFTSLRLLTATTPSPLRFLFIWHLFDSLIHFLFEGSYLYNCFFIYTAYPIPSTSHLGGATYKPLLFTPPDAHFLGRSDRLYGANYGTGMVSRLWQEYAKADKRWGGADLGVISLEILTVGVGGPLAAYIAYLVVKAENMRGEERERERGRKKVWWWASVLATGELYGGWMTFAPEWLSGSVSLVTSNWMYLWVYLFFMNTLWVWIPLWILWKAFGVLTDSTGVAEVDTKKRN